jgi:hypothetical protein
MHCYRFAASTITTTITTGHFRARRSMLRDHYGDDYAAESERAALAAAAAAAAAEAAAAAGLLRLSLAASAGGFAQTMTKQYSISR